MIPALFTGSRVYGRPTKKSDADLVILVSKKWLKTLRQLADEETMPSNPGHHPISDGSGEVSAASLRFGRLNVIACTNPIQFACWQKGTDDLVKKKNGGHPSTRDQAKKHFRGLRSFYLQGKCT